MVLEECPLTLPVIADVCRGAIDAHLHFGRETKRIRSAQQAKVRRATLVALWILYGCPVVLRGALSSPPRALLP
jgi:hypothetical protein